MTTTSSKQAAKSGFNGGAKAVKGKRGFGDSNAGRAVGTPNKSTQAVRELFREALDTLGGADFIVKLARAKGKGSLAAKMSVLGAFTKLLPHEVSGTDGEPLTIRVQTIPYEPPIDPGPGTS